MRLNTIRLSLAAGTALAAMMVLAPVLAQSVVPSLLGGPQGLRGMQDADSDDDTLTVKGRTTLDKPPISMVKPGNVARAGLVTAPLAPPTPPIPDPAEPPPLEGSLDAAAAATPPGPPVLDPLQTPLRRAPPDDDPFGPVGIDAGAFLLKPSIEVDFGYDSNPERQPGKVKGASFVTVTPHIDFASDWSRSDLRGSIDGSYQDFLGKADNKPHVNAVVDGRFDVTRDTSIETEARLLIDSERIGDGSVPNNAVSQPTTYAYGASLGAKQQFGKASLELRGNVDRNQYEDVTLSDGSILSAADRNYNTYGLTLRGAYELTDAVQPFVEVDADHRLYDDRVSSGGLLRDSQGWTGKAGATLALTGKLHGEFALGYGLRRYDDPTLPDLKGVITTASLVWDATALTSVTLRADTQFDETTQTGSSGEVARTIGVDLKHSLRRNLIATASVSETFGDYDGISRKDDTFDASLGIEYRLSRSVAIKASYAYEHLSSTIPGTDYTANTVFVGLKLQR